MFPDRRSSMFKGPVVEESRNSKGDEVRLKREEGPEYQGP